MLKFTQNILKITFNFLLCLAFQDGFSKKKEVWKDLWVCSFCIILYLEKHFIALFCVIVEHVVEIRCVGNKTNFFSGI